MRSERNADPVRRVVPHGCLVLGRILIARRDRRCVSGERAHKIPACTNLVRPEPTAGRPVLVCAWLDETGLREGSISM
jgi:hypothetical protein